MLQRRDTQLFRRPENYFREERSLKKKYKFTKDKSEGNYILMKQYILRQRDMETHNIYSEEYVSQIFGNRKASDMKMPS